MIYDFRNLPTDPYEDPYRIHALDAATGIPLPVFYYDTETHVCGRMAQDFDGSLLARENFQAELPESANREDEWIGLVRIWEIRELRIEPKPARAEEEAATARRSLHCRVFGYGCLGWSEETREMPETVRAANTIKGSAPDVTEEQHG